MQRRVPRLDKIRTVLDFRPRFNLDQIIQSVRDYQSSASSQAR
jgi:hypothetical protein